MLFPKTCSFMIYINEGSIGEWSLFIIWHLFYCLHFIEIGLLLWEPAVFTWHLGTYSREEKASFLVISLTEVRCKIPLMEVLKVLNVTHWEPAGSLCCCWKDELLIQTWYERACCVHQRTYRFPKVIYVLIRFLLFFCEQKYMWNHFQLVSV